LKDSKTDDEDYLSDLNIENDAEYILEYLENFNDLFDSEKYMQAAYYAAASPRSILRNIETLYKFKSKRFHVWLLEKFEILFLNSLWQRSRTTLTTAAMRMTLCLCIA